MKIALAAKTVSLSHGGAERFTVNLAKTLTEAGHQVEVVANQSEDLPADIPFRPVPMARKPAFWRILSFARNARRLINNSNYDIVYGLTQIYPQHLHRMGGGIHRHWMRVRYPFFLWRWLNYLFNPAHLANLFLEFRIYRPGNYQLIVTNSKLCKEHAQKYYQVPAEKIEVVYNGVDLDLFRQGDSHARQQVRDQHGLGANDQVVLFVSSNWKRKGLPTLLRAMARLKEKNCFWKLVVVGRGKPRDFQALAKKLGVEKQLVFAGPTRDVEKYYQAADLFVLPTLYDPFANVCLEAMACGLPVITSADNGAAEIVRDGMNGYVQQDVVDDRELADLLERCLSGPHRNEMGRIARETAENFTLERNMKQTLALFKRLLQTKDTGALGT